nr:unnamed protein product [Callosobruchus analis]
MINFKPPFTILSHVTGMYIKGRFFNVQLKVAVT